MEWLGIIFILLILSVLFFIGFMIFVFIKLIVTKPKEVYDELKEFGKETLKNGGIMQNIRRLLQL